MDTHIRKKEEVSKIKSAFYLKAQRQLIVAYSQYHVTYKIILRQQKYRNISSIHKNKLEERKYLVPSQYK